MLSLPDRHGRSPLTTAGPTAIYHTAVHPTTGGVLSRDCRPYSANSHSCCLMPRVSPGSLSACMHRRPSSPPVQWHACSSTPCAPRSTVVPHSPGQQGRAHRHACFSTPCAHARHRRPARVSQQGRTRAFDVERAQRLARATARRHFNPPSRRHPPPPRHWGGTCDRLETRHGSVLACTVPTRRTPPRLPPGGRVPRPAPNNTHSSFIPANADAPASNHQRHIPPRARLHRHLPSSPVWCA